MRAPVLDPTCEGPRGQFPRSTHLVITGSAKERLETEVRPLGTQFLQERGLVLSPEKTKITHITDGFDFLGPHLRDYHGTILVKPLAQEYPLFAG